MRASRILLTIFLSCLMVTQACAQGWGPKRTTGTTVGGLSGGAIGAALGSKNGKTTEGAIIGGLAGAILGNSVGNQADRHDQRMDAAYQQEMQQRYFQAYQSAVSHQQVIQMAQSGLSPEIIVQQIQRQGITVRPTIDDMIYLKSQGVSDRVLSAMQNAWTAEDSVTPQPPQFQRPVYNMSRPVVVFEEYPVRPIYYYHPRPVYPACPPYHRSHFGLTIGF